MHPKNTCEGSGSCHELCIAKARQMNVVVEPRKPDRPTILLEAELRRNSGRAATDSVRLGSPLQHFTVLIYNISISHL